MKPITVVNGFFLFPPSTFDSAVSSVVVAGTKNSSHSGINEKRKTFSDSVNVGNSAISLATTATEVEMTNDDQQIAYTINKGIEREKY